MITIQLGEAEIQLARSMAKQSSLGGRSEVRAAGDRQASLEEDQIVGHLGAIAGHRYLFGNLEQYRISRWWANQNPQLGDGGYDVPRLRMDFKASKMRASKSPMDYRLIVRPRERHAGWTYVLILIEEQTGMGTDLALAKVVHAHLAGWAKDEELPAPEASGVFSGAHVIPAKSLHTMMPMAWVA